MSTTFTVPMGDRGRLVVPAELRARQQWAQGVPLLLIETDQGVIISTRDQAKELVRKQLTGDSLVADLTEERRAAARLEDSV